MKWTLKLEIWTPNYYFLYIKKLKNHIGTFHKEEVHVPKKKLMEISVRHPITLAS